MANTKRDILKTLKTLQSFSPRLFENEKKAFRLICRFLSKKKIKFAVQDYIVKYPFFEKYYLYLEFASQERSLL
jgi:hypothetical protein